MNKMVFKKVNYKIITLFLFCILITNCSNTEDTQKQTKEGSPVKIGYPVKRNLTDIIQLNANTIFLKKEIIRSSFQGFVDKVYKNIGDKINRGDILFDLKTKEFAADKSENIPMENKIFSGIIKITAKTDGVLTQLNYFSGDFISEGEQIAEISNPSSLRINLNVPYQYTDQLKIDSKCEIILPDGKEVKAEIEKSIPKVDPNYQTQNFILKLLRNVALPENLNVSAKIPIKIIKDAVAVPQEAVLTNETLDQFWIMKLLNDTTAVRVDIVKGIENNKFVQIVKPELMETERIIIDGGFGLPDTSKITISN